MPFYPRLLKSFRLLMKSTLACPAWVLKYKIQNTCIEVVSITYEKYSEARLGRSNTKCKICVLKLFGLLTKSTLRPSLGEDIYIYKLQSTEYVYWYHSDYCEKYSKAIAWRSNTKYKIRVLESFWLFWEVLPSQVWRSSWGGSTGILYVWSLRAPFRGRRLI